MILKDRPMRTSGRTYGFMHGHAVDAIYKAPA